MDRIEAKKEQMRFNATQWFKRHKLRLQERITCEDCGKTIMRYSKGHHELTQYHQKCLELTKKINKFKK